MEEELEHIGVVKDDCNGFPWKRIGYVCETDLAVLPIGAKVYGPDVVEALRTQIAELTRTNLAQAAQIDELNSVIGHAKQMEAMDKKTLAAQAAQIEMLLEVLQDCHSAMLGHDIQRGGDLFGMECREAEDALSTTPSQALAAFATKVREQCAAILENGHFLHDQAPDKLLAMKAARAIRNLKELP